ncbi:hypothetical protein NEUTE2DRAFT_166956 [Neurospora tetrasperma FGSC 2509]|nr:hypothetical protein NEUTE2DRAFT_166956 [Neurospora tetrasperma FGSC 2509]
MPGTQKRQSAGAATSPLQHAREASALTASRFGYFCIPGIDKSVEKYQLALKSLVPARYTSGFDKAPPRS